MSEQKEDGKGVSTVTGTQRGKYTPRTVNELKPSKSKETRESRDYPKFLVSNKTRMDRTKPTIPCLSECIGTCRPSLGGLLTENDRYFSIHP